MKKKLVLIASAACLIYLISVNFTLLFPTTGTIEKLLDNEELKAALTVEGITVDAQKEILVQGMQGDEVQKFTGSKCANTSAMQGAGTIVNFTDSNVWMRLKADLGNEAEKWNRKYSVDLENSIPVEVHNGKEVLTVKALVLGEYTDEKPASNNKKNA